MAQERALHPISDIQVPLSALVWKKILQVLTTDIRKTDLLDLTPQLNVVGWLVPLCSSFPHWPGVGKFLISALRHTLSAKPHRASAACVEAVTGRGKPGSSFLQTLAIFCWCPRVCC